MRNKITVDFYITNLPLSCAIRKNTTTLTMEHYELIVYNASLNTFVVEDDRRKVENILTYIVLDTDAFEWGGRNINQINVREGWIYLVSHHNGSATSESRISASRNKIINL